MRHRKPDVGLVAAFEPLFSVELTPGGVDSAYHPSEVGEMSTSVLG